MSNVVERKVCVTRCEHCGFEVTQFSPARGNCPQCGRPESQRHPRWIDHPHPETIAEAERNASAAAKRPFAITDEARTASTVLVLLNQGDWLEMRGGHDWGRVDHPSEATPFLGLSAALERLDSCGPGVPVARIVSESEAYDAE